MDDEHLDKDKIEEEEEEEEFTDEEEEGFMQGYGEEEEVEECAECGLALKKKRVTREIEGEEYGFCSNACADEFEETISKGEE